MAGCRRIVGLCLIALAIVSLATAASNPCKPNNKGGCDQANLVIGRCKGQCVLSSGSCICRDNKLGVPGIATDDSAETDNRQFLGTSQGGCYSTRDGCRNEGCGTGNIKSNCVNYGKAGKNDCRCVLPGKNTTATGTKTGTGK